MKTMMSRFLTGTPILASIVLLGCSKPEPRVVDIEPGTKGTFLAVGAVTNFHLTTNGDTEGEVLKFATQESKTTGISVGSAVNEKGESIRNESMLFIPASITKVVTAALALRYLGEDYRFTTELRWTPADASSTAQDLTIYSDGDPQITRFDSDDGGPNRARLREIARKLKDLGIGKLTGTLRLVARDARLDVAAPYEGYQPEDYVTCYGALAQAFNYRRNCGSLSVSSATEAKWSDPALVFPFTLNLKSAGGTSLWPTPIFSSSGAITSYRIDGKMADNAREEEWVPVPIADARTWFANGLLKELADVGIDVNSMAELSLQSNDGAGHYESRTSQAGVLVVQSDPLKDLVRHMNKPSDNFLADALFKAIAVRDGDQDIRKAGARAVKSSLEALFSEAGTPEYIHEVSLIDGSGLTRSNYTSPRAFLQVLKSITRDTGFPAIWNSLPIAGRDGTLEKRMKGTAAEGKARAKTGTLNGAYQLAGYVPRYGSNGEIQEYVPFVILSATTPEDRWRVRAQQDELVAQLVRSVNR